MSSELPSLTVHEILETLPDLEVLAGARRSIVSAGVSDPALRWDGASRYVTIDRRVLDPDAARRALGAAEATCMRQAQAHFGRLRDAVDAAFRGDPAGVAFELIALGEDFEAGEAYDRARQCYEAALHAALPLADRSAQVLALRRIGRVLLGSGAFTPAERYYLDSASVAAGIGDLKGEVIARTGWGNVAMRQGRFAEAAARYAHALSLIDAAGDPEALGPERVFAETNAALAAVRLGRLDEAAEMLARASANPAVEAAPGARAITFHVQAALLRERGQLQEARTCLQEAQRAADSATRRAAFTIDLAEVAASQGDTRHALEFGRQAEEYALTAGSTDYLARVYRGLGNLLRDMDEEDGFTFYEKALELARSGSRRLDEAETLVEYARLRSRNGGVGEAISYLDTAEAIFRELGAERDADEASQLRDSLHRLRDRVSFAAP